MTLVSLAAFIEVTKPLGGQPNISGTVFTTFVCITYLNLQNIKFKIYKILNTKYDSIRKVKRVLLPNYQYL